MKKLAFGLICFATALHSLSAVEPTRPYDADLFSKEKKVIFTNLEFLYWSVDESALDYALKMKNRAWGPLTEGVGKLKTVDFGWNPGFRINVGYFNAPHYWDAYAQYTYFRGSGHKTVHPPEPSNQFLNGTWPQPDFLTFDEDPLTKATGSIKLRLDLLELVASRRFFPNPHLRMRLFGGGSVAWVRQNYNIGYHDAAGFSSHVHNHWKFTGAGIRAGYAVDWFLSKGGLYFTGLVSAAVYAGSYHNISKQFCSNSLQGQFNTSLPLRNLHYSHVRLVPHVQILAGPSWQQSFKTVRTELFAGYELNFWANLHEVYRTSISVPTQAKQIYVNHSIVGLQGLTVRWNLDF